MAKAVGEIGVDTQVIERILGEAEIGDVVAYQTLSEAIGRNVQGRARYVVVSALRRLLRDRQMVFSPVRNKGYKRLDDAGIVGLGRLSIQRIHRTALRGMKTLGAVQDFGALTEDQKREHNLGMAMLGVMRYQTTGPVIRSLRGRVSGVDSKPAPMPTARLLDAIREQVS